MTGSTQQCIADVRQQLLFSCIKTDRHFTTAPEEHIMIVRKLSIERA